MKVQLIMCVPSTLGDAAQQWRGLEFRPPTASRAASSARRSADWRLRVFRCPPDPGTWPSFKRREVVVPSLWGSRALTMLSGLSKDVTECYRRAADAHELAKLAPNEKDRQFHLAREMDWLLIARTYQFIESMGRAIDELDKRSGVSIARACPMCQKSKPIRYDTVFVCTNCQAVFEAEKR
jgi:hypothetical protein